MYKFEQIQLTFLNILNAEEMNFKPALIPAFLLPIIWQVIQPQDFLDDMKKRSGSANNNE